MNIENPTLINKKTQLTHTHTTIHSVMKHNNMKDKEERNTAKIKECKQKKNP